MVSKRKGLEEKCQYLLKNNEKSEGKYSNMMRNMVDVKEVNHNLHILDQQWQNKYNQLLEQYDQIVDEFERYQDLKQNK